MSPMENTLPSPASGPAFGNVHECYDCGLLNRLVAPVAGMEMLCVRCGNRLRHVRENSVRNGLAWTVAAMLFYIISMAAPMIRFSVYNEFRIGWVGSGPVTLDDQGYAFLASVVFLTTVVAAFLKISGTFVVLWCLAKERKPRWLGWLYAALQHLKPWVMVEVYLLGFLVAYSRLMATGHVEVTAAVAGLGGLMFSMVAMEAAIDNEAIWEKIKKRRALDLSRHEVLMGCDTCYQVVALGHETHCPRCGDRLHHRKPDSMARAWALTIAAALLYIPSNIYPVMSIMKVGRVTSYTIFGGLQELWHVGLWPLAILVFIASIAIPMFKLVMMAYMLVETRRGSAKGLRNRTCLYRVLDFIGRWSMVDIFVVSILVAMVRFGWLSQITADVGGIYFAGVVLLTLLAVKSFDPRLMWDAAGAHPDNSVKRQA